MSWLDNSLATDLTQDGSQILLSVQREAAAQGYLIYIRNTRDNAPATLLGEGQAIKILSDGKNVIARFPVVSQPGSFAQFFLLPIGAGERRALTHDEIHHEGVVGFTGDQRLVFTGNQPGHGRRVWVQDLPGGRALPITPEDTDSHLLSASGQLLPVVDAEQNIWIYSLDGAKPRFFSKLAEGEDILNWTTDGKSLFVANYALPATVYRIDIKTGKRKLLFELAPADRTGVMAVGPVLITPDGKSYVYNYLRVLSDLYVATGLR